MVSLAMTSMPIGQSVVGSVGMKMKHTGLAKALADLIYQQDSSRRKHDESLLRSKSLLLLKDAAAAARS